MRENSLVEVVLDQARLPLLILPLGKHVVVTEIVVVLSVLQQRVSLEDEVAVSENVDHTGGCDDAAGEILDVGADGGEILGVDDSLAGQVELFVTLRRRKVNFFVYLIHRRMKGFDLLKRQSVTSVCL